MHTWPQMKPFDTSSHLDEWEIHGLREWAYRRAALYEQECLAVGHYLGHRLVRGLSHFHRQPLRLVLGNVFTRKTGEDQAFSFDERNHYCSVRGLLACPGQPKLDLNYKFADGQQYIAFQKPDARFMHTYDGTRIASRQGTPIKHPASFFLGMYTNAEYQEPAAKNCHDLIQAGSELVHYAFEEPYIWTRRTRDWPLEEVFQKIKAKTPMQPGSVREGPQNAVDPSIRQSEIGWVKYEEYKELHAMLEKELALALPSVTPQIPSLGDFRKPALQYTSYVPGHYYDWHEDGTLNSFNRRRLSFSLMLQPAIKGGVIEIENCGQVTMETGDLLIFPSYKRHRVTEVKEGERHSLVGWFEESSLDESPASVEAGTTIS